MNPKKLTPQKSVMSAPSAQVIM
jgi:hypothetical protein